MLLNFKTFFFFQKDSQTWQFSVPSAERKLNDWLAWNTKTGLTPERSRNVSRRVMYRFWQGLCISKALCLTFPAVESITLQLTTAACCDQKEQLLGPHGGNSMTVPDRGDTKLDHPIRHTLHKGIQIYCAALGLETKEREPRPGLHEALTVRGS